MRLGAPPAIRPRRCPAWWLLGLLLGALALGMHAAEPGRSNEKWIKVTTDHFTILTPAKEEHARKWAIELEQFRRGLQNIVPVDPSRLRPVTVVLFGNDRAMEPYVPLEKGRPAKIGGLFVRANDINTIMLSLSRREKSTRRLIFHEAVHWHLSALEGVMPLWLTEGLAELYSTLDLSDAQTYTFGAVLPEYITQMQVQKLLPLPQLLSIDGSSLLYNEGERASIFYAQSWGLAHYLFFGEDSPGPEAVHRYLKLLQTSRSPERAFAQAFGGDYATLEKKLRNHLNGGTYIRRSYARSTMDIERLLKVGPASVADVELARGSLLLGSRTAEVAEPLLRRAAELEPQDPRPWELLGHIALARRDMPEAISTLGKAAAAGSTSYLVYHNLAVSRMPESLILGLRVNGLDATQMDVAAADYRRAIRLATWHVPSYEGLAGLVYSMATFDPGDLVLLQQGLLQAPGNTMIEAGLGAAELRAGLQTDGRARLIGLCHGAGDKSPDPADAGVKFAREVLSTDRWKTDVAEIERLARENRFDDVIALTDRSLARSLDFDQERTLRDVRHRMVDLKKISEAIGLANQGELAAAKTSLEALLEGTPHPAAKADAERVLREIQGQTRAVAVPGAN